MGQTYTACATAVAWSTAIKVLFSIFNGSGSGRIVRIRRAWILNNQLTGITGVLENYSIYKISTDTSGGSASTLTASKHDTLSENIPAAITIKTGNTSNGTAVLLRRNYFSGDEPATNTALNLDKMEAIVPWNIVWDVGYGNSNVQPLTLREGQGFSIVQPAIASSTGNIDIFVEFTSDAT